MKEIKILVADDEALARKRVFTFLKEANYSITMLEATTGKETLTMITSDNPDIVFLDIQMTDMTGFDVLQQLPKEQIPIIIFVTAFDTYAVKAFEVQALDFLLKPYRKIRFMEALERGIHQLQQSSKEVFQKKLRGLIDVLETNENLLQKNEHYLSTVVLKSNKKYLFVEVTTITYIKASGYYAEIYTAEGQKHVYRISMTQFIEKLDPALFSRVNRSAIINRNYVKEMISEGMGDYSIVMQDQEAFGLSKNYKNDFLTLIGIK